MPKRTQATSICSRTLTPCSTSSTGEPMSLVNSSVPGFVGGVSQQPPDVRHISQCEGMVNMVPSVAAGTRKRTGSRMIAKLASAGVDYRYAFVHPMDRGVSGTDDERY